MSDAIHAILILTGAAFSMMVCGAALTFGVGSVCRWMKWAPINMTVNINNYGDDQALYARQTDQAAK
jgi:hypothetical protein